MKKAILLLTTLLTFHLSLLSFSCLAQAPNWIWAKSATGNSLDEAYSTAVDASGNIYVAGYFNSTTLNFGTTTLTNVGGNDVFLAKYNSIGNVLWARSGGGYSHDYATSVAVDNAGNAYITGYFTSPDITFGTTTLTNIGGTNLTSDMFLAKYDPSGTLLLADNYGGLNDDEAASVITDASGNVFVAGYYNSYTMTIGSTNLTNADQVNYTDDIFLVKFNSGGSDVWAKSFGGLGWEGASSVKVDASGNSYISGIFDSPVITFGTTTLINVGITATSDVFLAKFDASGNVVWAISAGGSDDDNASSVALDASGNAYMAGAFASPTISFGTNVLTLSALFDIFLTKYDALGTPVWAKAIGDEGMEGASSVAVSTTENTVYITGCFDSPAIDFGSDSLFNEDINYYEDIFLAKYDAGGNAIWAKSIEGSSDDYAYSVATDASGSVYIAGSFYSPFITIGSNILTNADNTNMTSDIYIAKSEGTAGIAEIDNSSNISVFPNPATDITTVSLAQKSLLDIFNVQGKLIKTIFVTKKETTINISDLESGLYFIRVISPDGILSKKLIIE